MNLIYCELGIRRRALSSKKHAPLVHFFPPSPIHPTHLSLRPRWGVLRSVFVAHKVLHRY